MMEYHSRIAGIQFPRIYGVITSRARVSREKYEQSEYTAAMLSILPKN
jgi:hypothetical protein